MNIQEFIPRYKQIKSEGLITMVSLIHLKITWIRR